jgi:ketol-acid reductoisomerase
MEIPNIYDPKEYKEMSKDVQYDLEKFKDPYVVGAMIHRLVEERKYTNAMFKQLLEKIEKIEQQVQNGTTTDHMLTEVEERIVQFVQERGKTTAKEVQKAFQYKGKNGASARLNALHKKGILSKKRVGRKVFFLDNRVP